MPHQPEHQMEVPASLRLWFVVHAAVDLLAGVPLLLAPTFVLGKLGWSYVDPAATRLVGAALLAIGGQSWLMRDGSIEVYRVMLGLKVIWSLAASLGLLLAVGAGAPPAAWAFLCVFIVFAGVWVHHAIRFRQLSRAPADSDDDDGDAGTNADADRDDTAAGAGSS
jgi:hypothetical protein